MFAIGLVPDRGDGYAGLGGKKAGAQLCLRLMGETVSHPEGIFGKFQHACLLLFRLLVDAAGKKTAIDDERLSCGEGRGFGGEIDGCAYELFGFAEAAHGRSEAKLLSAGCAVEQLCVEVGAEHAWGDGVDEDAVPGPLDGERARERDEGGFAGGVGCDLVQCHEGVERGDVDDAAIAAIEHVFAEDLAGAQGPGEISIEDVGPLRFVDEQGGCALDFSGTVDEDIDLAEGVESGRQKGVELIALAKIGGLAERATSSRFDRGGDLVYLLLAAAGADDVGAGVRQTKAERATDAGGAADHNGRSAFEA